MNKQILFVDDEESILASFRRNLRKSFDIVTDTSPQNALTLVQQNTFTVIVADMQMPSMNGIEFLNKAQELSPDSVRIMLTGNADQQTAVQAVNNGEVFRFLTKPCDTDILQKALTLAVRQHQLITAEKELLNRTLKGSISALSDILSLAKPIAFGRVKRLKNKCREVSIKLDKALGWELDAAALLSQLGCINIAQETLEKIAKGEALNKNESKIYQQHPHKGAQLITKIPRLEKVANIVAYQHKNYDGSGYPLDDCSANDIPIEARILKVVLAFDERKNAGWSDSATLKHLIQQPKAFDPLVLKALAACSNKTEQVTIRVNVDELQNDMVIAEDILSDNDVLLVCRDTVVNAVNREHLIKFRDNQQLSKQILITHVESHTSHPSPTVKE